MRIARPSPFAAPGGPPPTPQGPPAREHAGGHPPASPGATRAVLEALGNGESVSAAARAGAVSRTTARRIWERAGHAWPPPGAGKGTGHHGPRRKKVTPAQAAGAARRIREDHEPAAAVARALGVSRSTLYRALARLPQQALDGSNCPG